MLAPWGPAAALAIRAFTVSNWHTATILLQKPCGKSVGWCWYLDQTRLPEGSRACTFRAATAWLAGLVLLTRDSFLQV